MGALVPAGPDQIHGFDGTAEGRALPKTFPSVRGAGSSTPPKRFGSIPAVWAGEVSAAT